MKKAPPLTKLPVRDARSHKGDFGRALLIGGSRGMSGAIALSGIGALRSGAGLVTLAVPNPCLETVAGFDPCFMTIPAPADADGRFGLAAGGILEDVAARATAVACGPGLGRSCEITELVRRLYTTISAPMVIDADGLNALADSDAGLSQPAGPRILTPHPGEFQRLCVSGDLGASNLERDAVALAREHDLVVVLKGHQTLVTDGRCSMRNTTGNPGMATGGSGDVLTGVITALLCQGVSIFDAARLGVHLHGLAGDLAARQFTQVGMTALDLAKCVPGAFREMGM